MLPTPAKFHYLFNMRELSKVFQGVILGARDRFNKQADQPFGGNVTSPEGYLLALWLHECRRVFADKLVSYDDKNWVEKALFDLMKENFQVCVCMYACVCVGLCMRVRLHAREPCMRRRSYA